MIKKLSLTLEQKQILQKILYESCDQSLREQALILLLINYGKSDKEIIEITGCSKDIFNYLHTQIFPEYLYSMNDKLIETNKYQVQVKQNLEWLTDHC
jgi:phenylacetate-coenzyme A ligase PaaK-like adenylate-forming protein